ncbi:peptidoglycan -binding protein [Elstera cyanobacteriorum]|uniref:peptidoglycan -binding protein n=1 Tax=Elstera cyanobacteriorum TaxID=2022747 RepID=UPI002356DF9D|nr:peptidoglycan -binding protein [Elstera cyanobacteriorum]MCK6442834.1 peptidoglycan -binding protein [Elstera cyanobacteriorum]
MPGSSRRQRNSPIDYWPGFVDALSTLLIIIIFLVLVFVLAQYYLNQALSGRDEALAKLTDQIAQLSDMLALEKANSAELQLSLGRLTADLQATSSARDDAISRLATVMAERDSLTGRLTEANARLAELQGLNQKTAADLEAANKVMQADKAAIEVQLKELAQLKADIDALQRVRAELEAKVGTLAGQVDEREKQLGALRDRSKELEARLATSEERTQLAQRDIAQRDIQLAELLARSETQTGELSREKAISADAKKQVDLLNAQIAALRDQLARIAAALEASEAKSKEQDVQIVDLGKRLNAALASKVEELARYRSEFFGKLREVLGERQDVRIVGDRFVFQSEVLFDVGSAELGEAGRGQLASLAATIKQVAPRIPADLNWVLRVDGHTDRVPIRTAQFPSNWELSTARAISVVRFMIDQGVPADRLAATGFGEFQPLDPRDDDTARRRNRRIEFKLTER